MSGASSTSTSKEYEKLCTRGCPPPASQGATDPSDSKLLYHRRVRQVPMPPPAGWRMEIFEVVPHLLIGTRLASGTEYATLGVDVIVDLEDWEWAWVPPVPLGKMYLSFPIDDGDEDEVDPKVRDVAQFIASLIQSGRTVLVHCTEGLNRSGVVAARALMVMGRTADEAIHLVRQRRGLTVDGFPALGNEAFVGWLLSEESG